MPHSHLEPQALRRQGRQTIRPRKPARPTLLRWGRDLVRPLGYEPKAMLERRRRSSLGEEAEDGAEVEVLKGGQTKALEDKKDDEERRSEEGQMVVKGKGTPSQGGEFLGTPSQPALEGGGKTLRSEETPAKEWKTPKMTLEGGGKTLRSEETPTKEWKTPKMTPDETPRPAGHPTSSTREEVHGAPPDTDRSPMARWTNRHTNTTSTSRTAG